MTLISIKQIIGVEANLKISSAENRSISVWDNDKPKRYETMCLLPIYTLPVALGIRNKDTFFKKSTLKGNPGGQTL